MATVEGGGEKGALHPASPRFASPDLVLALGWSPTTHDWRLRLSTPGGGATLQSPQRPWPTTQLPWQQPGEEGQGFSPSGVPAPDARSVKGLEEI